MNIYKQNDRTIKNVANQILNLVIITLEFNNPERKWGKIIILESSTPLDYLRNTIDHFSSKLANIEYCKVNRSSCRDQSIFQKTPRHTIKYCELVFKPMLRCFEKNGPGHSLHSAGH